MRAAETASVGLFIGLLGAAILNFSAPAWFLPVALLAGWILADHHWHHTSDEEGIDKNFAAFLPLWDLIFGTAHMPDHWPKRYGTVKFQPPESYLGQLFYPFRRKRATPYG